MKPGICHSRPWLRVVQGMMLVMLYAAPLSAQSNSVFDATTGYITVPHAPTLDVGALLTLEAWVRPSPPPYPFGSIVERDYTVGFSLGVEKMSAATDSVTVVLYIGFGRFAGPPIPANDVVWTHIAATVDTVAHQALLYVDGALVRTFTGPLVRFTDPPENLIIGRSKYGDAFAGLIDEVRIWNVVRSQSDILDLYSHAAKGNEPGLVAVYHFDDYRDTLAWNRAAGGGLHGSFSPGARIVSTPWAFDFALPWTIAYALEHEPNDLYIDATPMDLRSRIVFAAVAPGDTDTYKIYLRPGDVLSINTYAHTTGEQVTLGLSFVAPDTSTTIRSVEATFPGGFFVPAVEGYRYVRVYAGSTGGGGSYEISNRLRDKLELDAFEPNDSFAAAAALQWGSVITPTLYPGIDVGVAVPDSDYFTFAAEAGEVALLPYSIQGFGSGRPVVTAFGPAGAMQRSFFSTVPAYLLPSAGTYFARVHPEWGAVRYRFGLFKGLLDINGMLYDPCGYGGGIFLRDGWNYAYDNGYTLYVNGEWYGAAADYAVNEAGGRQFVFLPKQISGLNVSRKFYVPSAAQGDTLGYMRIQDILENPTGAPVTVTVGVQSDIGSQTTVRILETSNGDAELTTADSWALTNNDPADGRPLLTHVFDGIGGVERVDSISIVEDFLYWEWREITVQPGERKILMYFVAQDSSEDNAFMKGPAFSGSVLPAAATIGLGADGYNVVNWPTELLVSAGEPPAVPKEYSLAQNYPNPFNPETRIRFTIATPQFTILRVYDILGREVGTLVNEKKEPGNYEVTLDGRGLASGIYLYRLTAGPFVDVKKMALIR